MYGYHVLFIYPLISWWMFGLFLPFGYYENHFSLNHYCTTKIKMCSQKLTFLSLFFLPCMLLCYCIAGVKTFSLFFHFVLLLSVPIPSFFTKYSLLSLKMFLRLLWKNERDFGMIVFNLVIGLEIWLLSSLLLFVLFLCVFSSW